MELECARKLIHEGIDHDFPADGLILVLEAAIELLSLPDNDFCWSRWDDAAQAKGELLGMINMLNAGALPEKMSVSVLFAPTGPLQEVSLSSGWGEAFLRVASRYEEVEALLW